jgi:protein-S-isoprenylcysteine O-methyltransferase Ste14
MLKRILFLAYGIAAYAFFLGTFLYAIAFVGGFLVPTSLDGPARDPLTKALLINAGLLTLFAVQHSVMARKRFKEWWTAIVPTPVERSTYVLFSSLALLLLFWQWRPMGGVIWSVEDPLGRLVLRSLFGFGFALVLVATFLINHFDLFGLRQVYLFLRGREYTHLPFGTPVLYRHVRHPLYLGWLFAFWATPTMTAGHLLFADFQTAYMLIAIPIEERDLVLAYGDKYEEYRARVPALIPLPCRNGRGAAAAATDAAAETTPA